MKAPTTIILLFVAVGAFGQTIISGKVTETKGDALLGVNVYIKGTYDGATTGVDGDFSFTTYESDSLILVASFVGFHTQELLLEPESQQLKIELKEEINQLKIDPNLQLKVQKLAAEVEAKKAIARIKNAEADKVEGSLVDAEEVLNQWANFIQACKAKLIAVPSKLALELSGMDDPEVVQERLQEEIDTALTELSE